LRKDNNSSIWQIRFMNTNIRNVRKKSAATLTAEAGESGDDIPEDLTKAQASEKIEALQQKTGRDLKGQE
jgi:hypothetical protein